MEWKDLLKLSEEIVDHQKTHLRMEKETYFWRKRFLDAHNIDPNSPDYNILLHMNFVQIYDYVEKIEKYGKIL